MSLPLEAAQAVAQRVVDERQATQVVPIALAYVKEYPSAYVFTFNSQVFVETGAVEHALAGGVGPIIVRKDDGSAVILSASDGADVHLGESPVRDWFRVHKA